ncbi:MAG: hypothetical protein FWD61_09240 [Phycisphaerales bacterium]|nr:hypothetical protein [Phycisphaerales bacterium]
MTPDENDAALAVKPQARKTLHTMIRSVVTCDLHPLTPPAMPDDFDNFGMTRRMIASLGYFAGVVEYRLGPNGWLRAWIILGLRVLLFIAVPLLVLAGAVWLLVPVFMGLMSLSRSLSHIAQHLERACHNIFMAVVWIIATFLLVGALAFLRGLAGKGRGPGSPGPGRKYVNARVR